MKRIFAIARLTVKAAFRFRFVMVLAVLLGVAVVLLPLMIKSDGTARGFTQILLTYTLTAITGLLGLATLWLACGTLARDVEECQMQMVVVKPVPRWQIWLGKWLGILLVDAILLGLSGLAVFFLMEWRAGRLPPKVRHELRAEVLVARGSASPPIPNLEPQVERLYQQRIKNKAVAQMNPEFVRQQIRDQVKAGQEIVPPGYERQIVVPLGLSKAYLKNKPLFIRFKCYSPRVGFTGTFHGLWLIGPPETAAQVRYTNSFAPNSFVQFKVPAANAADLIDANGNLTVGFVNLDNAALLFPLEDGLEVLYPVGGFGGNFIRGLAIILCWMALLAALGLAASSLLSFPVAAFASLSILLVAFCTGTLSSVVQEKSIMGVSRSTGSTAPGWVNHIAVPVFQGFLFVIHTVEQFSPIDFLSTGRNISWLELGKALGEVVFLMGGFLAGVGVILFTRRELATAQGFQ